MEASMERRSLAIYAVAAFVTLASFAAVVFLPVPVSCRQLFSIPALGGLLTFLAQGWRDQLAHERARDLQARQQDFTLGIASHMANTVFDKQVAFCEEYARELHQALSDLFGRGPSQLAGPRATALRDIRRKYAPWISDELVERLMPFEKALNEIATDSQLLEHLDVGPMRTEFAQRMYDAFSAVLGIGENHPTDAPEAIATILSHLHDVLGVSDFEDLRRAAIREARSRTEVR
jgi:hypothetical protein